MGGECLRVSDSTSKSRPSIFDNSKGEKLNFVTVKGDTVCHVKRFVCTWLYKIPYGITTQLNSGNYNYIIEILVFVTLITSFGSLFHLQFQLNTCSGEVLMSQDCHGPFYLIPLKKNSGQAHYLTVHFTAFGRTLNI